MLYCCILNLHFKPNIELTKASIEFENLKMLTNITEVLASQQINSNNSGKQKWVSKDLSTDLLLNPKTCKL